MAMQVRTSRHGCLTFRARNRVETTLSGRCTSGKRSVGLTVRRCVGGLGS